MAELNFNKKKGLGGVKSKYIKKGIFDSINEKLKLDIIIYNKYLQKELEINIEDYKRVSGK